MRVRTLLRREGDRLQQRAVYQRDRKDGSVPTALTLCCLNKQGSSGFIVEGFVKQATDGNFYGTCYGGNHYCTPKTGCSRVLPASGIRRQFLRHHLPRRRHCFRGHAGGDWGRHSLSVHS